MMKNCPDPPLLELGFYFGEQPEVDVFPRLITNLMEFGASLTGKGLAHYGPDIRAKSFASIFEEPLPEPVIVSADSLTGILNGPGIRIVEVAMRDPIGIAQNAPELVSYVSISPEAALIDRHPLTVITEGEVFCGVLQNEFKSRRREAGMKVYSRFRELVQTLDPEYASITVEHSLQCPADLRRDPRSLAFRDFFVSERYLGSKELARIQEIFTGAFIEPISYGFYVSCNADFNPAGRSLESESAQWLSVDAAKVIAFARDDERHK
jgi:hypothetical protein